MSATVAQERITRLVRSGFRGECRPAERMSELKARAGGVNEQELLRLENVFSGLADKTRLKILKLMASEELCACEVTAALELTQPTTSHHLGILERAGLVVSRREGKWVFYHLADPKLGSLLVKGASRIKRRQSGC